MSPLTIVIPGDPVPYARTGGGKGTPRFTPRRQRHTMEFIRLLAAQEMAGRAPLGGPVSLTLRAVFEVPKSWPKKRQAEALTGGVRPTKRPDISNLVKLVEDALNQVVYADDAQIVSVAAEKCYGPQPLTIVTIMEV